MSGGDQTLGAASGVKRYKIEMDWADAWVVLEVDHGKLTPELASEINRFWTGAGDRLAFTDGDAVTAVIKMAGSWFLSWVYDTNTDYNTLGMQREFDQLEGWPPHRGHGITLVAWDGRPDLDSRLLEISEVAGG